MYIQEIEYCLFILLVCPYLHTAMHTHIYDHLSCSKFSINPTYIPVLGGHYYSANMTTKNAHTNGVYTEVIERQKTLAHALITWMHLVLDVLLQVSFPQLILRELG